MNEIVMKINSRNSPVFKLPPSFKEHCQKREFKNEEINLAFAKVDINMKDLKDIIDKISILKKIKNKN
jgi:hypothetical protein